MIVSDSVSRLSRRCHVKEFVLADVLLLISVDEYAVGT